MGWVFVMLKVRKVKGIMRWVFVMLSVRRVKDIMWLALIEKVFTNHEIKIRMQTRYLCFKSIRVKTICVTLIVFSCGKL